MVHIYHTTYKEFTMGMFSITFSSGLKISRCLHLHYRSAMHILPCYLHKIYPGYFSTNRNRIWIWLIWATYVHDTSSRNEIKCNFACLDCHAKMLTQVKYSHNKHSDVSMLLYRRLMEFLHMY